ncbi:MAG: hypothetical protein R2849_10530 [Thermomicrobiales bacterium]
MAAGLPVVVTLNGGGSDDILDHGRTGLYCGVDPASIADGLQRLIDDPGVTRGWARAVGVDVARRRYGQDRYRSGIMRVYDSLCSPAD